MEQEIDQKNKIEQDALRLRIKILEQKLEQHAKLADANKKKEVDLSRPAERQEVKYTDNVDVFSLDESVLLDENMNYLDLWIGQNAFDELNVAFATNNQIKDLSKMLTFVTVDFYNHETLHTNICEGSTPNYDYQFTFKVVMDDFFFHYLGTGFIKIEIYAAQSQSPVILGQAHIKLSDLITLNQREGVSAVVSATIPLYLDNDMNRVISSIEYKMRLRQPIYERLKFLREMEKLDNAESELEIVIDKGIDFPVSQNCFVFYQLQGKDHYTDSHYGPRVTFSYRKIHDIYFDEKFVAFLKQERLQFSVLDDPINQREDQPKQDLIGIGTVYLQPLLKNQTIQESIEIKDQRGMRVGYLSVKIFWYQTNIDLKNQYQEQSLIMKTLEQDMTLRIAQALRTKGLGLITSFAIFDRNQDKIIDFNDFYQTITGTLNLKMLDQEIDVYFKRLPKPLNMENYEVIFKPYLSNISQEEQLQNEKRF